MTTIRTRIARLSAASAVVVSLGALTAGPTAAQGGDIGSGKPRLAQAGGDIGSSKPRLARIGGDIGSRGASFGWAGVESTVVTFGGDGWPAFTLAAADGGP